MAKDPKKVFVVHGRNEAARNAMFQFLGAIGLNPIEWTQAILQTGEASPTISQILEAAFSIASAVVVLLTGDDVAKLRDVFIKDGDEPYERIPTPQSRPNVLFEAGLAFGTHPKQTILVQLGDLRPFSDIAGRHVIRMNNKPGRRNDLANRLKATGCEVDLTGERWLEEGDFESCLQPIDVEPFPFESTSFSLGEMEIQILNVLAQNGVEYVPTHKFAQHFGIPDQQAQYHLDNLTRLEFVHEFLAMGSDATYSLDEKGREYLFHKETLGLSLEEKELLIAASQDGDIKKMTGAAERGDWIVAGGKQFVKDDDPSFEARYLDALDSLESRNLVRWKSGILYKLKGQGWDLAKALSKQDFGSAD